MNWAGIVILVLYGVSLLISAKVHGELKKGKNSFWVSTIAAVIMLTLMYFAGTFN